jgi:fructuronate reductase
MAGAHDPALSDWIAETCTFPQTMVDRIVPATTDTDIDLLTAELGLEDQAMVKTEPFSQWVIEDNFAGARPDLEGLGVVLTHDVSLWETVKLRTLNGAHSTMAYAGGLAGIEFVHDFVRVPALLAFVDALWDELVSTLILPPQLDIAAYRAELLERFGNETLQHRLRQIAADGSQKLPQRLVAPMMERSAKGLPSPCLSFAVAAWIQWQGGVDDTGQPFTVDDPMASTTAAAVHDLPEEAVRRMLAIKEIFPANLLADSSLMADIADALANIRSQGARAAAVQLAGPAHQ